MKLAEGEIYISPFDLNIEHGKIEQPLKPMIRFATPIFDDTGTKKGMLILNYLGNNLIDQLDDAETPSKVILLNREAYWLRGLSREDEWGFMYPDKQNLRFSIRNQSAWEKMHASEAGQFIDENGMYTFSTIHPIESSDYYWKIASFVPAVALHARHHELRKTATVLVILLSLSYFMLCIIIAHGRELAYLKELDIHEKDAQIRNIVDTAFDAIITINRSGIITSFNPAAQALFGYSESEAVGQNVKIIVPSPHQEMHDDYISRYTRTKESHIIGAPREFEAQRKDGSLFPIELCVAAKELDTDWLFTGMIRDITERKQLKAELEQMATTDALTGIFNRGHFNQAFEVEFQRSQRYQLPLSIIIMDADHFKSVNDDYGHPAGDAFLIALAQTITNVARQTDVVARYGGEEFVVVLPQTDGKEAMIMAERLRESIEVMTIEHEGHAISRTASIGVASLTEVKTEIAGDLLKQADQALYKAKESGRNRVVMAET